MQRNALNDIEYKDKGCWYHDCCLTCPFDDCVLPDTEKPLGVTQIRTLKKRYPDLKGRRVAALQCGKVVMI